MVSSSPGKLVLKPLPDRPLLKGTQTQAPHTSQRPDKKPHSWHGPSGAEEQESAQKGCTDFLSFDSGVRKQSKGRG